MKIAETVLDFCTGDWGEDRLYAGRELVCVIDGATPISKQPFEAYHSSAEWMAEGLRRYVASECGFDGDFPALCRRFVDATCGSIRGQFPDLYDLPCLTVAALWQNGKRLSGYVLGDCSIYALMKNGDVRRVTDQRTAVFYNKTLEAREKARRTGQDVQRAVREQRIRNKAAMNRPDGYWTVAYTGDFERMFRTFSADAEQVDAVLLCTDGFDRLFSLNEIRDFILSNSISSVVV